MPSETGELTADAFKSACGSAGVERCTRLSLARRGLTAVLAAVNLADLDLSRNRLGERPWRVVGPRKLRTLHLGWCAIRELGDSLHDLASLEHLLIQGNLVEDAGALARSLARLPSLRSLHLRENERARQSVLLRPGISRFVTSSARSRTFET